MKDLVSIIVSVFNVEDYLPKCLESVSRQSYDALDIILIDDGSTDGSGAICDSFAEKDRRARVIHQDNKGLWAVRNRGQEEARGDYLIFVDGDDYFHDDFVSVLYEAINKDGHHYPVAICRYKRASDDSEDTTSDIHPVMDVINREQLIERFFSPDHCTYSANWNKMYRKESIENPFQRNYARCQDMDSNLHAYLTTIDHAIVLDDVLYYWRIRPGQLTGFDDYYLLINHYKSLILYDNHINLPAGMKDYDHYLLMALYRSMVTWMKDGKDSNEKKDIRTKILKIENKTAFVFLFCKHEPLMNKVGLLLLLDFPFCNRLLFTVKQALKKPHNTVN